MRTKKIKGNKEINFEMCDEETGREIGAGGWESGVR
jgi:hypothetical protein